MMGGKTARKMYSADNNKKNFVEVASRWLYKIHKVLCAVFKDALLIACNKSHMNDSNQATLLTVRSSLNLWFI
jgi:hypothetical protein